MCALRQHYSASFILTGIPSVKQKPQGVLFRFFGDRHLSEQWRGATTLILHGYLLSPQSSCRNSCPSMYSCAFPGWPPKSAAIYPRLFLLHSPLFHSPFLPISMLAQVTSLPHPTSRHLRHIQQQHPPTHWPSGPRFSFVMTWSVCIVVLTRVP